MDDDCWCRGGVKDQGLWKWFMDLGKEYYDIVMCVEENVVMIWYVYMRCIVFLIVVFVQLKGELLF